jgi:hypothetical protein
MRCAVPIGCECLVVFAAVLVDRHETARFAVAADVLVEADVVVAFG